MDNYKTLEEITTELRKQEAPNTPETLEESVNKILYRQLCLLAEYSLAIERADVMLECLPSLSKAMIEIADRLKTA